MSLYNALHGYNSMAGACLAALGLTESNIPRFRDAWYEVDEIYGQVIVIYTRTGGGNRDFYDNLESCMENYPEYFEDEDKPNGPWNCDLVAHPNYLRDEDDGYDETYAKFYFSVPDAYKVAFAELKPETKTTMEKWEAVLKSLEPSSL